MKKLIYFMIVLFALSFSFNVDAGGPKPRKSKSYSSGHYSSGRGSSHKGGKYKNSSTNNHYRKRK